MDNFTNVETLYERTTKLRTIKFKIAEDYAGNRYGNPKVFAPEDAAAVAEGIFKAEELDADQEHMLLLALTTAGKVRGYKVVSSGGLNTAIVEPRIVYRAAILLGAASIIMVHNHPSGKMSPSKEDIQITKLLRDAGEIVGIPLHDHIIIDGYGEFTSLAQRGF